MNLRSITSNASAYAEADFASMGAAQQLAASIGEALAVPMQVSTFTNAAGKETKSLTRDSIAAIQNALAARLK